ncbi:HAD-IA family hydrolase [Glycomyces sp. TRM65418]|uniref:HAD-IA family hydrolase n=1 Tax=Glycomyces sp. TRM65418 TaxID=2867006 RepID=UPI001CE704CD|nr:HAD-IA family hydrolase [Glycomyces sp. TRM65418]MCC3761793.1 HAD-IA family hydrolase [Glycomyces sp. TRM65418]QZD55877.1 HAD-IA family hydrolase [Glycomyces sp. TRM65418]
MRNFDTIRAVLFDMDGTLVESDAAVERAWEAWAVEYSVEPSAALAIAHGAPAPDTVAKLRADLDPADVAAAAARQLELQYDDLADVTATPGAHRLIGVLDRLDLPWAVVTSADGRLARARLAAAGITPPLLLTVEDVTRGKPDPEGYLLAADRLGVDPADCLVVEDSEPGLAAGRAAGATTASLRGLDADLILTDLGRLARLLRRHHDPSGWWQDAAGYQVYLPSFADSDGDGWGDLPGVAAHLDHIAALGVDMLWLTPFFASPMRDHGYDVSDYLAVDPSFGGEQALDDLIAAAHRRGLRVIGDLVVNHTSDRHRWFREAAASRESRYRDHYIWRDPAPGGGPPNNWLSHFGGPAWTYSEATGQYHLHLFKAEQPDLNWRNPAVAEAIDAVIEHWLDRGLDGFRIDTAAYLVKHPDLPSNPLLPPGERYLSGTVAADWALQDHRYDIHQPDVHAVHERWRRVADRHGALLVGEIYETDPAALTAYLAADRLHSAFWFGLLTGEFDPAATPAELLAAAQTSPGLSWAQGNHDCRRAATRFGARRSLALHAMTAFLPGLTWIYQGEELGLEDGVVPPERAADPLATAHPESSRDSARTPMPWDAGPGLGFTTGEPWLPLGGRTEADTVASQEEDPNSPLRTMRRLMRVRHAVLDDLPKGLDDWQVDDGVAAFRRGSVQVFANLGATAVDGVAPAGPVVFDSDDHRVTPETASSGPIRLAPGQAVVAFTA